MIELQSIILTVFASVLGDQILIMIMTGLVHLCGRSCANVLTTDKGMAAADDAMPIPEAEGLIAERL